jgi:hypothetical protein
MKTARRGYTLTELVAASALTLVASLGGLTALTFSARVSHRAELSAQVRKLVAALDRAAPSCNLEHAVNNHAATDDCATLNQRVAAGAVHLEGRLALGPLSYRIDVERAPALSSLLQATVTFVLPDGTPLRHVLLLRP